MQTFHPGLMVLNLELSVTKRLYMDRVILRNSGSNVKFSYISFLFFTSNNKVHCLACITGPNRRFSGEERGARDERTRSAINEREARGRERSVRIHRNSRSARLSCLFCSLLRHWFSHVLTRSRRFYSLFSSELRRDAMKIGTLPAMKLKL